MSGGSLGGGDGRAWRREQKDVLEHAKQLGYDRAGGSIISETDDKAAWEKWRNDFVGWKNRNVALEKEGKAFWQQPRREEPSAERAPVVSVPTPSPIQQRAERNVYFPMLVPEYSAPQALDYSAYTSMSPFGGDGGLLYQPGTQQYREAYPIADNILSYQPPEIGFPQVTYSRPVVLGIMEEGEEGSGSDGKKSGTKNNNDLENRGGKGPGDIGYTPDNSLAQANLTLGEMIAHVADVMQGGQGVTGGDMAGWGDPGGGASVGGSGGSSGVGPGGVGGGVGKGY